MGNCLFGGMGDPPGGGAIRVTTSNGGVMEFYPPVTAGSIAGEFPGHAIFRSHDLFWKPLQDADELLPGNSYHLLPLTGDKNRLIREGHVRSASVPGGGTGAAAVPYRMSFDCQGTLERSYTDVFARPHKEGGYSNRRRSVGFWKVKLVISPEQLLEILSQEGRTQELIESVRTVAKCGGSSGGSAFPGGFSDEWSLSTCSSMNASSSSKHVDGLMVGVFS